MVEVAAQPQTAEIEKKISAGAMERDVESGSVVGSVIDSSYPAPTEEERATLRKVADSIPYVAYLLCLVELAERASFYGVKTVFNNFMQFPLPEGGDGSGAVPKSDPNGHAGALGMGLQFASAIGTLFTFLAYIIPIFGAWLADAHIGRYRAIVWGVLIGGVAHVIMIGGAAPAVLRAGNGIAPFMISFFLLAIGAGIFKPCVAPTIIDQYTHQREYVKTLKSGERVIVDPETTIGRIMMVFYSCVNVGSFFAIATTYVEKYVGFWVAFLLPGVIYFILPIMLWWMSKRTIKKPAEGSDLLNFCKVTWTALKRNKCNVFAKNFWDKARPSVLREAGVEVQWSDKFVTDVKRTMEACQIFLYFPIYNINDGGIGASQSNQGASMTSAGAPNDLLSNFVSSPGFLDIAFASWPLADSSLEPPNNHRLRTGSQPYRVPTAE
jgi:dipeptide/tripeptide permease